MLKFNDIIFIILFGGIILSYVDEVIETIIEQNPSEPEFHQAIREVLESLRVVIEENEEEYKKNALLERLTNPERQFKFRVPWVDDNGQVQVNTCSMGRRQRSSTSKHRLQSTVQLSNWTLQRRITFPPIRKPRNHQVLRI